MRKIRLLAILLALALSVPAAASVAGAQAALPQAGRGAEPPKHKKAKVIVDADMGQLNDDAVATFMLVNSGSVDVLGVTIVAGNTWVEEGTAYALRQLELIKARGIPVVPGAGEPLMGNRQQQLAAEEDLFGNVEYMGAFARQRPPSYLELPSEPYGGYPKTKPARTTAVDFIVNQVKKYPNEVTIFALGPATNLALAVKTHPEIVPLIKEVIYMGGAIDVPGNTTPAAEFNWWFDPEAAKMALRTPFKRQTVVPLDIAEAVFYTKAEYDRIVAGPETPLKKMFKDLHGPRFARDPNSRSFVWDALTSAIFLDPEIATRVEERYVDVDATYGPNYGRSIGYGPSRRRSLDNPDDFPIGTQKVRVLFDIDRERFWDLYVELMQRS